MRIRSEFFKSAKGASRMNPNARAPRRSSHAVTISDVAARAGVSSMTVSNVLSGRKKVQESTRQAVLQAAENLGYVPNIAAQALASATPIRIGLIYRNPQSAFLSSVLVGALNAASRLGVQLLIRKCDSEEAGPAQETLTALIRSGSSGILLPAPFGEIVDRTPELQTFGIPMMAMSSGEELANVSSVRIDDFEAARQITEKLISLGHRRIALIKGPDAHRASASRLAGYSTALTEAGIEMDPQLIVKGDFSYDSGLLAAQALISLSPIPTAIFATNDDMAAAVVSEAHRRHLVIPDDISIAGFDDTPIAVKIWPPLTTVRQPIADIAEQATVQLIERLRLNQPGSDHEIISTHAPFTIIERESTGPARKG